jgi:hypothetical protein
MGNQIFNRDRNNQTNVNVKRIKYSDLFYIFKQYSTDGKYLELDKFNDSITSLLKFELPILHSTYLIERMFYLVDKTQIQKITCDEFVNAMHTVLNSGEARCKCNNFFSKYTFSNF